MISMVSMSILGILLVLSDVALLFNHWTGKICCNFICSTVLLKDGTLGTSSLGAALYSVWPWPLTSLWRWEKRQFCIESTSTPSYFTFIPLMHKQNEVNFPFFFSFQWQLCLWLHQHKGMYLYQRLLYLWWLMSTEAMRDYRNYNI